MAREKVNEGSPCWLELTLYDRYGQQATPLAITYRVDDILSGVNVLPSTVGIPAPTMELEVSSLVNAMQDADNASEPRRITWTADIGQGNTQSGELLYDLKNLVRV
mgnify:CR=1 FL=1